MDRGDNACRKQIDQLDDALHSLCRILPIYNDQTAQWRKCKQTDNISSAELACRPSLSSLRFPARHEMVSSTILRTTPGTSNLRDRAGMTGEGSAHACTVAACSVSQPIRIDLDLNAAAPSNRIAGLAGPGCTVG